jgi:hypothetical protein
MGITFETDPREHKLPGWATEIIAALRREQERLTHEVTATEAENTRLRAVINGKYGGDTGDADTFYVNDDTAQKIPLGQGVTIRFGVFYDVRYDVKAGLLVEGDSSVAVHPVSDYEVAVVPREVT